jgi:tRNA threonylcarbamoyladenosine biosynthesis protein TsaE
MHDSDDNATTLILPDEAATLALGASLAPLLPSTLVIYLEGDLGAGKTTLVRGLLRELGYAGKVKSPTYTFVELYAISRLHLYHFDFYRFEQPEEYLDGGFDEYFQGAAIFLVEWPDKAGGYLPPPDVRLRFTIADDARMVVVSGESKEGRRCLTNWNFSTAAARAATSSNMPPPR